MKGIKNRPLHSGEMEFHLTGMRQREWNPLLLDHPAEEVARPEGQYEGQPRLNMGEPELRPME
ncbi:MAG TPA: hypothetical protein VNZ52_00595 [Candidatus Thermoplasmatota archaeon]|nr:hypothetical protein [Candidatus Thermoplasmatota archaeon]